LTSEAAELTAPVMANSSTGADLAMATGVYVAADAARRRKLQERSGFRRLDASSNGTGR
jgi:hypothetical protein